MVHQYNEVGLYTSAMVVHDLQLAAMHDCHIAIMHACHLASMHSIARMLCGKLPII